MDQILTTVWAYFRWWISHSDRVWMLCCDELRSFSRLFRPPSVKLVMVAFLTCPLSCHFTSDANNNSAPLASDRWDTVRRQRAASRDVVRPARESTASRNGPNHATANDAGGATAKRPSNTGEGEEEDVKRRRKSWTRKNRTRAKRATHADGHGSPIGNGQRQPARREPDGNNRYLQNAKSASAYRHHYDCFTDETAVSHTVFVYRVYHVAKEHRQSGRGNLTETHNLTDPRAPLALSHAFPRSLSASSYHRLKLPIFLSIIFS